MLDHRNDPVLPAPCFPGSHLVVDDAYVFVSGLTAADLPGSEALRGDIRQETRAVLSHLERLLNTVGCGLADCVRVDVHLADLEEMADMDAVYAGFFPGGRYPARTCVQVARLYDDCRVEITLIARRPGPSITRT